MVAFPAGKAVFQGGIEGIPAGKMTIPAGKEAIPTGIVAILPGMEAIPAGKKAFPAGNRTLPSRIVAIPVGTASIPAGMEAVPNRAFKSRPRPMPSRPLFAIRRQSDCADFNFRYKARLHASNHPELERLV